jgi:hypothetical protein
MDAYTVAFGIRNMTDRDAALSEAYRVLKRGGRLLCLEFSHVSLPVLKQAYDLYSFSVIPKIGGLVAGDEGSYQYLVESIRQFPDQVRCCCCARWLCLDVVGVGVRTWGCQEDIVPVTVFCSTSRPPVAVAACPLDTCTEQRAWWHVAVCPCASSNHIVSFGAVAQCTDSAGGSTAYRVVFT